MTRTEPRQWMILRWQGWIQAFTESRRWISQTLFKKVKVKIEIEVAKAIIKSLIEKFIEHLLIHWTLLKIQWTWSCMFDSLRHANMSFWRRRYCYDFGSLADYAEDASIIRARFSEQIKRIFRDVQKILIGWVPRILSRTLVLIRKRVSCL